MDLSVGNLNGYKRLALYLSTVVELIYDDDVR